ncbi:SAM-dependent methyltransferase [Amycolatopsis azurea]|uniref:SAM-dependent methyltransferase n=1 Tax=Amycolatopsis azurea TaxID=36819 RepID=UPI00380B8D06
MTTPDPYFLTPHGTVPDQEAEANHPTIARVNGVLLDKALHEHTEMGIFQADLDLARKIDNDVPGYRQALVGQRQFLTKAITFAATGRQISQFVVLRAGLPLGAAEETEHTLVRAHIADATTLLVARETFPSAHQGIVLEKQQEKRTASLYAAVHEVHRPLHAVHEPRNWSLDLGKPVGLTMVGDPAHWPGDVYELLRAYQCELAPGSMVAVSTLGPAPAGSPAAAALESLARHLRRTPEPELTLRDRAEIENWFTGTGWKLHDTGVAAVSHWSDPPPDGFVGPELPVWCAIATVTAS